MKPVPDSAEWWQEVAQGLGVTIHDLKAQVQQLTEEFVSREERQRARAIEAEEELDRLREALQTIMENWQKSAQTHENYRHHRDDPYDDVGCEHQLKAQTLLKCATDLSALLVSGGGETT